MPRGFRRPVKKSLNAGRKSDPGGPEYANMKVANGMPELMNRDAKPGNAGGLYCVVDDTGVPFDSAKFKAGDEVALYVVYPLKSDRSDIKVALSWSNGVHTAVLSRSS